MAIPPNETPTIVGVLNVTPDSFSDGGKYNELSSALERAHEMLRDGADVIEIGGESTRPGSVAIDAETELSRVLQAVKELSSSCVVSIDTYKRKTAEECLKFGAKIINDVSGLRAQPEIAKVVADFDAKLVIMYSKEDGRTPHVTDSQAEYDDVIATIREFLSNKIEFALSSGIRFQQLIIDPGLGRYISHDPKYSWEIIRRLPELRSLGAPVLVGASRKGFLGQLQEGQNPASRDAVSQLVHLECIRRGASYIRTHEVKMMREFLQVESELSK